MSNTKPSYPTTLSKALETILTMEEAESAKPPTVTPIPLNFTVEEFLQANRIGRTKFYELVHQGVIRIIKVGRRTLIPRAEMEAWIYRLPTPPLFPEAC